LRYRALTQGGATRHLGWQPGTQRPALRYGTGRAAAVSVSLAQQWRTERAAEEQHHPIADLFPMPASSYDPGRQICSDIDDPRRHGDSAGLPTGMTGTSERPPRARSRANGDIPNRAGNFHRLGASTGR
jgi:hypothetical protein